MDSLEDVYYLIAFIFIVIGAGTLYLLIIGNPVGIAFLLCIFAIIYVGNRIKD